MPNLPRVALAAAIAFGAGVYLASGDAVAQEVPSSALCVDVPQTVDGVDEVALAAWMTQQIGVGRVNFESVQGIGTVVCAW